MIDTDKLTLRECGHFETEWKEMKFCVLIPDNQNSGVKNRNGMFSGRDKERTVIVMTITQEYVRAKGKIF